MKDDNDLLELNPSQLRNHRNWTDAELPIRVQTLALSPLEGVSLDAATQALGELISAHEGLRSRLCHDDHGNPRQRVISAREALAEIHDSIETKPYGPDADLWATVPVQPREASVKAVFYLAGDHVSAIKLSLSHVFVDSLGKQAVTAHLAELLRKNGSTAPSITPQASAYAKGNEHPDVRASTAYWKSVLADAPRSCTYGAGERPETEQAQVCQVPLERDAADRLAATYRRLRVSPQTAWVAALSTVVGLLSGQHRHTFKTTHGNRVLPADFRAVAQIAQPFFSVVGGDREDTLRMRVEKAGKALDAATGHTMYDANALLDWLNSEERSSGSVFQPAFEVNYVPTIRRAHASFLYGPAPERLRNVTMRYDPHAGKPDLALTIRHLPDPLLLLTVRGPLCAERDARKLLDHGLTFLEALAEHPDLPISELGIPELGARGALLYGHRSEVAIDPEMTRRLLLSAHGVTRCELTPRHAEDGSVVLHARLTMRGAPDEKELRAQLRRTQPWYAGAIVPDVLVIEPHGEGAGESKEGA
ncbi:condensation domain-containing protein [Streptomyces sp. NPDC046465]|uniref:condensation domain-containing protein n=1 Tax=Streptomyces sp. NPDC046465 TaxID=3155810 RepID=UPI0033C43546